MDTITHTTSARCLTMFGAVIEAADELNRQGLEGGLVRALLLMPTALVRPAELVASDVTAAAGVLRAPSHAIGQVTLPARTLPLGGAAQAVLGADGSLYELLGVGRHGPGGFLRTLAAAYGDVAPEGLETLEQLWSSLTVATLTAQTTAASRRDVTHYAGLAGCGQAAQDGPDQWPVACDVGKFLDTQVRACGYEWEGPPTAPNPAQTAPARAA